MSLQRYCSAEIPELCQIYRSHEYVAIATDSTGNGSDFIEIHEPLKLDLFHFKKKKKETSLPLRIRYTENFYPLQSYVQMIAS